MSLMVFELFRAECKWGLLEVREGRSSRGVESVLHVVVLPPTHCLPPLGAPNLSLMYLQLPFPCAANCLQRPYQLLYSTPPLCDQSGSQGPRRWMYVEMRVRLGILRQYDDH